jgi:hypothetical protein
MVAVDDNEPVLAVQDQAGVRVECPADEEQRGGRGPASARRGRRGRVVAAAEAADGRPWPLFSVALAELAAVVEFGRAFPLAIRVRVAWASFYEISAGISPPEDFLIRRDEIGKFEDAKPQLTREVSEPGRDGQGRGHT